MVNNRACRLATLILLLAPPLVTQNQSPNASAEKSKGIDYLLNYLNMAGTNKASDFRPITQRERTHLYLKTLVNPFGYVKAGLSAGIDQWNDKPQEWEQGASGYGKRFANILGQHSIQRTVTFGCPEPCMRTIATSIRAKRTFIYALSMLSRAVFLLATMMEAGISLSPRLVEQRRALFYPACGSLQVSIQPGMARSALELLWAATSGLAW
jgi:hypothetical protein